MMATEQRLDLIDRKALRKLIDETHPYSGLPMAALVCTLELLEYAPTIEARPVVHGEWKDAHFVRAFKGTNIPVVQCSKCECYFCDIINNHHYMYHYCPNCGAQMDGGADNG